MTTHKHADPVAAAEDTLAVIGEKKAEALARKDDLLEQAGDLGFRAYGDGDVAAQKRIRELSQEAASVDNELVALDAAENEGGRRLAAARREAVHEARRAQANAAKAKVPGLRTAGAELVEALDRALMLYDQIYETSDAIRKTGVGRWPRDEVFEGSVRRSLQASLARRRLNTEPLITAPAQRKELSEVLERFISELEFSLERELDEPVDQAAE